MCLHRIVPAPLKLGRDQPIERIHGFVVALRAHHLIARLLQCQFLLPNPLIARAGDLLGRFERGLDTEWCQALQHLLRYQLISVPPAKARAANAPSSVRVTARIARAVTTGVGYLQLAATTAA